MPLPHRSDPPSLSFEQLLAGLSDHHKCLLEEMVHLVEENRRLHEGICLEPFVAPKGFPTSSPVSHQKFVNDASSCSVVKFSAPRCTVPTPGAKGDDGMVDQYDCEKESPPPLSTRPKLQTSSTSLAVSRGRPKLSIEPVPSESLLHSTPHQPSTITMPSKDPPKVSSEEFWSPAEHYLASIAPASPLSTIPSRLLASKSNLSSPEQLSAVNSPRSAMPTAMSRVSSREMATPGYESRGQTSCYNSNFSVRNSDASSTVPAEHGVYPHWFKPRRPGFRMNLIQDSLQLRPSGHEPTQCLLSAMGATRLCWDCFWCILLCYEMWVLPVDLVFMDTAETPRLLEILRWILVGFFALDIVLNFNTSYVDGEDEVMDRWLIAANYMRSWFALDLIATVPWGEVLSFVDSDASSTASSTVRVGKVSKLVKIVKMSKLVRAVKIVHHLQVFKKYIRKRSIDGINKARGNVRRSAMQAKVIECIEIMARLAVVPLKVLGILLLLSHFLACCYGWICSPPKADDFDAALRNYSNSVWWSFSLLSFGSSILQSHSLDCDIFYMFALWVRLLLALAASMSILLCALRSNAEEPGDLVWKKDALAYLRSHSISENTQVQVLKIVHENGRLHKRQRNFNNLMNHLPTELARTIRSELWCDRLTSLGLFCELASWCGDLLPELAQVVQEESYASRVIVFKEGDPAVIAYMVLTGSVAMFDSTRPGKYIAPFTADMWFGEKALVNPELRRSATAVTETVSHIMAISAFDFFALIEKFCLKTNYQYFCVNELWKGLCGRCGVLGDHWSNECTLGGRESLVFSHTTSTRLTEKRRQAIRPSSATAISNRSSRRSVDWMSRHIANEETHQLARDLKLFVNRFQLENIIPTLVRLKIFSLDDCLNGDKIFELHENTEFGPHLREGGFFTQKMIHQFRSTITGATKAVLQVRVGADSHYFFLSHYKVEAGTEAALMRSELETLINDTESHPAQQLKTPIFLDSEDLTSLFDLMQAVRKSHNVVVMLTKNLLTRPWCLVEIVTAVQEGIPLIPVNIMKVGCEFEFPDAMFYEDLMDGTILGNAGLALLRENGIDIAEVSDAIKVMLKRIAIPYSPHRPVAIRRTECQTLVRMARMRDVMDTGRLGSKPGNSSNVEVPFSPKLRNTHFSTQ